MGKKPIIVKSYKNDKSYRKDAPRMARRGYEVSNVESFKERQGCAGMGCKAIIFLPWAFLGKKPALVVTYKLVEMPS